MDKRTATFVWIPAPALAWVLCCALAAAQLAGAVPQATSAAGTLTVERIYGAPSLSGRPLRNTSWSPDGKLLTYLDSSGASGAQIWAVDAATGQKRLLVDAQH